MKFLCRVGNRWLGENFTLRACARVRGGAKKRRVKYVDLDRPKLIKREKTRLKRICKDIPKHKLDLLDDVLKDLAILSVDLNEIEKIIEEDGKKAVTKNGRQEFIKAHPLLKTKAEYVQKRKDIINMILGHMPDEVPKEKKSRLAELAQE